jgi:hypothetical protein
MFHVNISSACAWDLRGIKPPFIYKFPLGFSILIGHFYYKNHVTIPHILSNNIYIYIFLLQKPKSIIIYSIFLSFFTSNKKSGRRINWYPLKHHVDYHNLGGCHKDCLLVPCTACWIPLAPARQCWVSVFLGKKTGVNRLLLQVPPHFPIIAGGGPSRLAHSWRPGGFLLASKTFTVLKSNRIPPSLKVQD